MASVTPSTTRVSTVAWPPPVSGTARPPVTGVRSASARSTRWIDAPVSTTNGTGAPPFTLSGTIGCFVRKLKGIVWSGDAAATVA